MIIDSITAILFGGLPVAVFTFLVLQWSIASGRLERFGDSAELKKQFEKQKKARKKTRAESKKREKTESLTTSPRPGKPVFHKDAGADFFHNKVMFFGGGFYGTMALFTYAIIEIEEIWQFLGAVFAPGQWFVNLGFDLILGFFINSITNIVKAFTWFSTLPDYAPVGNGFIWLVAAYGGYMLALKVISKHGDVVWASLGEKVVQAGGLVKNKAGVLASRLQAGRNNTDHGSE